VFVRFKGKQIVITDIHQSAETHGIDGDLEEGVYLTMVDGISDIMEDMEVRIICQQLYRINIVCTYAL
jgi:hypothetical protein